MDPSAHLHPHSCQWGFNAESREQHAGPGRDALFKGSLRRRHDVLMETSGHLTLAAFIALFDGSNIT